MSNKVIKLADFKQKTDAKEGIDDHYPDIITQEFFKEAIKQNEENKKRLQKDRLKANKSVLRSYRIKE